VKADLCALAIALIGIVGGVAGVYGAGFTLLGVALTCTTAVCAFFALVVALDVALDVFDAIRLLWTTRISK